MHTGSEFNTVETPRYYACRGWVLFCFISLILLSSIASAFNFDNVLAWSVGILYVIYDTWLLSYVAWKTRRLTNNPVALNNQHGNKTSQNITHENTVDTLGVLVPVYNESNVIIATIEKLLEQDSKPKKIIIVNDGSTDDTLDKISQHYVFIHRQHGKNRQLIQSQQYQNLYLFNKENSGKADSLNQAMAYLDCDLVVTVDADTLLESNAISEASRAFSNNINLVAACGILKPVTSGNIFSRIFGGLQYFEYLRAFLSRAAWSQSNALLLVSGAFSVYKRKALVVVGGYDPNSLVEDYELIHRMHKHSCEHSLDWQISVIENARATTDAPSNVLTFIQQRKRWFAGFLKTQFKYRHMIGNRQYKYVGRFMLPIKTFDTLQPIFGLIALFLLINFLHTDVEIALHVIFIILIKLLIDYCFHFWSLAKYHTWLGQNIPRHRWWQATLCCLADPFFFQPLRHISALIGWSMILTNKVSWEPIRMTPTTKTDPNRE